MKLQKFKEKVQGLVQLNVFSTTLETARIADLLGTIEALRHRFFVQNGDFFVEVNRPDSSTIITIRLDPAEKSSKKLLKEYFKLVNKLDESTKN